MVGSATPICTNAAYSWTFNTLGQSPCVIAEYLGGVCNAGVFLITQLQPGRVYLGPTHEDANPCRCSSVFYSLISACALCQSGLYLPWSGYDINCTTVYTEVFPQSIPGGTKVPHYAYLDVVVDNTFNITAALGALNIPESTFVPVATSNPTTSALTIQSSIAAPAESTTSSVSKAGPIAGGVIGGVVFLGFSIAAFLLWWTRHRRGPKIAPSSMVHRGSGSTDTPRLISNNTTQTLLEPKRYNNSSAAPILPFTATPPSRLYDSSDPSTYPPSTPATCMTQEAPFSQRTGNSHYDPSLKGHYTGAPEI